MIFLHYFYPKRQALKPFYYIIFFFIFPHKNWGQYTYLEIKGNSTYQSKIIDSIPFSKKHLDSISLFKEINKITKTLTQQGYIEQKIISNTKFNDSTRIIKYELGSRIQKIHIYLGNHKILLEEKQDTLKINFKNLDTQLLNFTKILEKKGFPLTEIKLSNIKKEKQILYTEITIPKDTKRSISEIRINGYSNFPKNHLHHIQKHYQRKTFNENISIEIKNSFKKFPFCKTIKEEEVLFSKDSTIIYAYLEKQKKNTFDGYIGFTSLKNKLKLNGHLDLKLLNTLNSGEKLNLYWNNNGDQQSLFNLSSEIPYIFRTSLSLKGDLNFFKQDSTFQKTKSEIELGYLINYNTRCYIGYQETESSDIQNSKLRTLTDYKNYFYTISFQLTNQISNETPFSEKTNLIFKTGAGKRNTTNHTTQYFISAELSHLFLFNNQNSLFIKSQNYYLNSNFYLTNELFRFGGINSIRGFNDNSLQAHFLTSIISEYRYKINHNLYIHSIIDYAHTEDATLKTKNDLKSFGLGFYLINKKSLIHIQYSNGRSNNTDLKIKNSIFHINLSFNL
ncbi:hypothetical protein AX766_09065 [Flavobacterium covae]|uniref:POTRA domain-containing protein n=2 Tax=Flavobacterium TaxID=237 RepID=A0AA94F4R5_9FLAO|nr:MULTISPECIES: hypothetical protein [Flavobacterium]AND64554.1 hypothetical protein AX766_09065 [Flavobacterium covae]MCH4829112.1 hypothetical protein [Flavobacterium columnare]MCH4833888.1 hypothetical protein [Flavobacterium columnare]